MVGGGGEKKAPINTRGKERKDSVLPFLSNPGTVKKD
jgi:hypothetical protein